MEVCAETYFDQHAFRQEEQDPCAIQCSELGIAAQGNSILAWEIVPMQFWFHAKIRENSICKGIVNISSQSCTCRLKFVEEKGSHSQFPLLCFSILLSLTRYLFFWFF